MNSEILSSNSFKYAGFWSRLGAHLIDGFLFGGSSFLYMWGFSQSRNLAILLSIIFPLLASFYVFYFHARWGQTIGKMVLKIKVLRTDGSPIGWKEALLRQSVDLVLGLGLMIGAIITLNKISESAFAEVFSSGFFISQFAEFGKKLDLMDPTRTWFRSLHNVWIYSEFLVLLFNKQKRAIHDFIAGTIVVHKK